MTDDIRYRAGAVFGESAAAGFVLGWGSVFLAVLIAGTVNHGANLVVLVAYGGLLSGFGGGVGVIVGMVVGMALYTLVRAGEPRLGARAVAYLVPVVALCITLPPAIAIGLVGSGAFLAALVAIIALLTIVGSVVIARRYLRRAEGARVH